MVAAKSPALDDLLEAYDEASVALERFQRERNVSQIAEYENICSGVESDVIEHLLSGRFDGPN